MLSSALLAMMRLVGDPSHSSTVTELKHAFEERTGHFEGNDAWFEARSAAFLDDALVNGGMAKRVERDLDPKSREYVVPIERAHRGLFQAHREHRDWLLIDRWSGVELVVSDPDPGLHDALASASGYFDGYVVGAFIDGVVETALLPGAVFHREDATSCIDALIPRAHEMDMKTGEFLDALLRMDHALRSLSRVKASFAYRVESLRSLRGK